MSRVITGDISVDIDAAADSIETFSHATQEYVSTTINVVPTLKKCTKHCAFLPQKQENAYSNH